MRSDQQEFADFPGPAHPAPAGSPAIPTGAVAAVMGAGDCTGPRIWALVGAGHMREGRVCLPEWAGVYLSAVCVSSCVSDICGSLSISIGYIEFLEVGSRV